MASPRQPERKDEEVEKVEVSGQMKPTQQREVVQPVVEKPVVEKAPVVEKVSEEMVIVALFEEMCKKVDEIYVAALEIESTPQLAKLLGEVGVVKATLTGLIGQFKEADEMRKAEEVLMANRAAEREVE